ncbi:N-acetylmuramate alpha-1-phosphate uridylyltransferase MurU [Thalassotalea sp. Y01]|uniref:N-acetylmuramate alpha-1-phosphate uridylyltransferase MurU n=1 Tax=Thalassotalea sp. Y01 TaxID=2729613 RepID=UPI00145C3EE1|nr:nucleotidyltransferase family protein [Thalassotalea sp. Y01]NMP15830.1 nucleotidyltransferase family protein [Thalassotalea sp. Y01]
MKVMILAAGRGERMRPLTDNTPKPLLKVAGIPLIEHHILALKKAGYIEFVINLAWLGEQIEQYFSDGSQWGIDIQYSWERDGALETAGGIVKALPLLGEQPFLLVNGDVYCDVNYADLKYQDGDLAQLLMVENPEHNPQGDFCLQQQRLSVDGEQAKLTYAGIGIYQPQLFAGLAIEKQPLAPILRKAMAENRIGGQCHQGLWSDVGTIERLQHIDSLLRQ